MNTVYEEMKNFILVESRSMISAIDKNEIEVSIDHAYNIFLTLSTDELSMNRYEDLYWFIQDEILPLILALWDLYKTDKVSLELFYETVQHKPKVVPRLYLLVIFGCLIMRNNHSSFESIAFDILDMCRAVQAPLKGLYLRKFLVETLDIPTYFDNSNDVSFGLLSKFLLENFRNMNKLWVRIKHTLNQSDIHSYDSAHEKLIILIHACMKQISELKGITSLNYHENILPEILLDIINCKEPRTQEILTKYVLELFSPKLNSLATTFFIQQSKALLPDFDYQSFISQLCYSTDKFIVSSNICDDDYVNKASILHKLFDAVVDLQSSLVSSYEVGNKLAMFNSILAILVKFIPNDISFISNLLNKAYEQFYNSIDTKNIIISPLTASELRLLLFKSISHSTDLNQTIATNSFIPIFKYLENREQIFIALQVAAHISQNHFVIKTMDQFIKITQIMDVLLTSKESLINLEAYSAIIVSLNSTDINIQIEFYTNLKIRLLNCELYVYPYICPTVVHSILKYINYIFHNNNEFLEKELIFHLFKLCIDYSRLLPRPSTSQLIIQLLLLLAMVADNFDEPDILKYSESSIREAFTIFEEDIVNSGEQSFCLKSFIYCLYSAKNLESEVHDQLSQRCERLAASFVSYQYQCSGLIRVSMLHWRNIIHGTEKITKTNPECVKRCLDRAIRVISSCIGEITKASYYTDLINICCYYFEEKCPTIDAAYIDLIIEKAKIELALIEGQQDRQHSLNHLNIMINYYLKIKQGII